MDKGRAARVIGDRGVTSVQFLLASGLAFVLFLTFANLVVVQYGRGAIRSALEQGARAGSVTGVASCEDKALDVTSGLLGGRMSDGLTVTCRFDGSTVVAEGSTTFQSWTPLTPDFHISLQARSVVEP